MHSSRGNKHLKLDLEAAAVVEGPGGPLLVAFGSGSTPRRTRLAVAAPGGEAGRLVEAAPLYAAVSAALPGAEVNIEGAFPVAEGILRILQRGNGAGGVNASFDLPLSWLLRLVAGEAPDDVVLEGATRWELGDLDGVPLSFTDGTAWGPTAREPGRWLFTASAEASPDAVQDGPVSGSAIGWADDTNAALVPITDADGAPVPVKVEGIAPARDRREVLLVTDPDEPHEAAELLTVRLEGPWGSGE